MKEAYDSKYKINSSDARVKEMHTSRRMFAIKDRQVYLAPENAAYSHAKWFELLGWINPEDDSPMNYLTRGYFNSTGVYFYKGYDFKLDKQTELDMKDSLADLVKAASISTDLHLFGGIIKQEAPGTWPPRKDYGEIKNLLSKEK